MLPICLRELLNHFIQLREQARRKKQISEKNRHKIDALTKSSIPIKLELGAGENRGIAGWTYADMNEQRFLRFLSDQA